MKVGSQSLALAWIWLLSLSATEARLPLALNKFLGRKLECLYCPVLQSFLQACFSGY